MRRSLSLSTALLFAPFLCGEPDASLIEAFENPPHAFRPLIIAHAKPLKQPEYLDEIYRRNAGGAVLDVSVRPKEKVNGEKWIDPSYCDTPEYFQALREIASKLAADNRPVWIYDELGYPSGSAAGRVIDANPDFENWAVSCRRFATEGADVRIEVVHPFVQACLALPQKNGYFDLDGSIDLSAKANEGSFTWTPPQGQWLVCLFERFHPDAWKRHNIPRRGANIMDRAAMAKFIEITHQRYARELGDQLNDVYLFFTDEPQFGSHEHWSFRGKEVADPTVQWCDELPEAFLERKGYPIANALPALFLDVGPATSKFRHDFYDVQSDLVAENFYGQVQDWCHANGTLSSGHQLLEESLLFHVMFSGSVLKNWMRMDLPGVDLLRIFPYHTMGPWYRQAVDMPWLRPRIDEEGNKIGMPNPEDYSCKLASSIAHLMGKPGVFTESFAVSENPSKEDVKGIAAWQFAGGVTHMSTYTIQNQLSEEDYANFARFAGRLAVLARRGRPVADVAVLVPEASVWAAYSPPAGGRIRKYMESNPEAMQIDHRFRETCFALNEVQRDYECFTEDLLREAEIIDGRIEKSGMSFHTLLVPECRMLSSDTLAKIGAFLESGGKVAFVGSLPSQSPHRGADPGQTRIARSLLRKFPRQTLHAASEENLPAVVDWIEERSPSQARWEGPSGVRMMRRQEAGREIFLLANPGSEDASGVFSCKAKGQASLWNPENGEVRSLNPKASRHSIPLHIPAKSARFVVFDG